MKWNKQWKTLNRDQRQAWKQWARNNPVLLDHGVLRRVSGEKAFSLVLNHRVLAGDAANPTVVPAPVTWLVNVLSLDNAGPFTAGAGNMSFRAVADIAAATKWFVWATGPLAASETLPLRTLRFIKCLAVGVLASNNLTANFASDYRAVQGSFNGPGTNGAWSVDHFVWFRLHQYANGQLGPGVGLKGRIQVEL